MRPQHVPAAQKPPLPKVRPDVEPEKKGNEDEKGGDNNGEGDKKADGKADDNDKKAGEKKGDDKAGPQQESRAIRNTSRLDRANTVRFAAAPLHARGERRGLSPPNGIRREQVPPLANLLA